MYPVSFASADRMSWSPSMDRGIGSPAQNSLVDLCVAIICGLGLVMAAVGVVENSLFIMGIILAGTIMAAAIKTRHMVIHRPWSPFHWMTGPRWYQPSMWNYSEPTYYPWSSPNYYPTSYYSSPPRPRNDGWMRNHYRGPGLPSQA